MAKHKVDREDLIREGTAMAIRGRMQIGGNEVVIGFRAGGVPSLYWNQDPVFQFDADGRLRRVYFDSNRYKSCNRRLVRLTQSEQNTAASVGRLRLVEETVSIEEQDAILMRLSDCLQQIRVHLQPDAENAEPDADPKAAVEVVGASDAQFRRHVLQWVAGLSQPIPLADHPSA